MDEILKTIQMVSFIMVLAPIMGFIASPDFNFWKNSKIDEFFKFASMRRDIKRLKYENFQTPFWRKFLWFSAGFHFLMSLAIYLGIFSFILVIILKIF